MRKIFPVVVLAVFAAFGYYSFRDSFNAPESDPRETAAVRSLGTIVEAQEQYRSKYRTYAEHLYELGPPRDGGASSEEGAALIPRDLALGQRYGYNFEVHGYGDSFTATADPVALGGEPPAERHFFSDQSGVIRENVGGPANASSKPVR